MIRGQARFPSRLSRQSRLFAADIGAGPAVQINVEREIGPLDVLAEQVVRVALLDRPVERAVRAAEFITQVDVRRRRADGVRRDHDPFQELMRIVLHQDAIVERARLALVAVHAEVKGARMVLGQEGPFDARRKAGAAAAAQPRILDHLCDVVRGHSQGFSQRLISAVGAITSQGLAALFAHAPQQNGFKSRHGCLYSS